MLDLNIRKNFFTAHRLLSVGDTLEFISRASDIMFIGEKIVLMNKKIFLS